uniref:Uncharacterized protein n=1 Tax=Molossus molossus TaxID=27622 RepID=A0A7J8DC43_MOLMO|nr:hypothetical protein HJG59_009406 [Molossus molossus]
MPGHTFSENHSFYKEHYAGGGASLVPQVSVLGSVNAFRVSSVNIHDGESSVCKGNRVFLLSFQKSPVIPHRLHLLAARTTAVASHPNSSPLVFPSLAASVTPACPPQAKALPQPITFHGKLLCKQSPP